MILYEKRLGAFNLLLRFYGSPCLRAALLAVPSTILAGLLSVFTEEAPQTELFLNPATYSVLVGVVSFVLIFRTNLSYARYWEGRSMVAQMSAKWGDAAIQVITFDEAAKEPAVRGGTQFRSEFVHMMSLMHAMAMMRFRGDWNLDHLVTGDFTEIPPEPPVDAAFNVKWQQFEHSMSLFRLSPNPTHYEKYWACTPLPVIGGVNETEVAVLEASRERVFLVMCWVLRALVARRMAGGISQDAPIVSRIYQVLSDGMLGYENAYKICTTPFPFPFAQGMAILLHIHAILVPVLMSEWIGMTWLVVTVTFVTVFAFYLLNEIAREIEDPFKFDPNDLPVNVFQHDFNARLVTAFAKSIYPRGGLFSHINDIAVKEVLEKQRPSRLSTDVSVRNSMEGRDDQTVDDMSSWNSLLGGGSPVRHCYD